MTKLANHEVVVEDEVVNETPQYGSEGWHDFAMTFFEKDEIINGNPLCRGLRRVASLLLGDIVSSGPVNVLLNGVENNNPGRATVVYEVQIAWGGMREDIRSFGDVAEVWYANTDDVFLGHPSATACTRAEGRCLRKALMLNCLAAEELTTDKDIASLIKSSVHSGKSVTGALGESSDEPITSAQKSFLIQKCKQLDLDVMEYINLGEKDYKSLSQVSKRDGIDLIKTLTEIQNQTQPKPNISSFSNYEE